MLLLHSAALYLFIAVFKLNNKRRFFGVGFGILSVLTSIFVGKASKICMGMDCIIGLIQSLADKYGQRRSKIKTFDGLGSVRRQKRLQKPLLYFTVAL